MDGRRLSKIARSYLLRNPSLICEVGGATNPGAHEPIAPTPLSKAQHPRMAVSWLSNTSKTSSSNGR